MFRFEHIELLWALLLLPGFFLIYTWMTSWRNKAIKEYGDSVLLDRLIPERSSSKPLIKLIFYSLAYLLLIISLANPQIGTKLEEVKREGVDIMIALDVSNSMLAEDLAPNRLERAKHAMSTLFDELKNDRIGIVVFAGDAYVQLPITTDYSAAKLFLSSISTQTIKTQGTDIGNALDLCMESFDYENGTAKSIIIITDGENHQERAIEAVEEAVSKGITVHTIGMGSAEGAPIPLYRNGQKQGFLKDKEGSSVVTKLNEEMLTELADIGNGAYARSTNGQDGLGIIFEEIDQMDKTEIGTKVFADYEDRYQYFLGASILLLIMELLISERRNKWLSDLFSVKAQKA